MKKFMKKAMKYFLLQMFCWKMKLSSVLVTISKTKRKLLQPTQ